MTALWLGIGIAILAVGGIVSCLALYRRTLYAASWILVVGPDDGSAGLGDVLGASLIRGRGFRAGWNYIARQLGLKVWGVDDGVVVDVAGFIAFPEVQGDLAGWRRVLRLLGRHRPRRPVDALILAIPAKLLLASQSAPRDYGAVVRDRLAQIQSHFGFILPLYVVVTQCEELHGFAEFADALPESARETMLGWSNDRTATAVGDALAGDLTALHRLAFRREWIIEGMANLERSLVPAQITLLGWSQSSQSAAGLMLVSRQVARLTDPLAGVLEEALRPNVYNGSCFLRGFYLSGSGSFVDHLLHQKVFRERGLAIPRPAVAVSRLRRRLAAQMICAGLAVVLTLGTAWSYIRLDALHNAYSRVLAAPDDTRPGTTTQQRLIGDRAFLEQAVAIRRGRLSYIAGQMFMPASIPTERQLSSRVAMGFEAMLGDFTTGLEEKWNEWNRTATFGPGDSMGPLGPDLKETAPHKALDRFADGYKRFAENYERYLALGRPAGAGNLTSASGLLEYLTGAGLSSTTLAPGMGGAVRRTRTAPIDCRMFLDSRTQSSVVSKRASDLLLQFQTVSFGLPGRDDARWSNVVAGGARFKADWASIADDAAADDRTLADLMDDTSRLSDAVKAWAVFRGPSSAVAIPAFDKPPFKQRPPSDGFCDALRPDLSSQMRAVEDLRDKLTPRVLDDDVMPFGRLVDEGEAGLAFTNRVASFKNGLDNLRRQSFWPLLPADLAIRLPANPTWRKEDIDAAVKIGDAFDAYRGGAFLDLDDSYRAALLDVVETGVAQAIASTLASSATAGRARVTRPEEITALGAELTSMGRVTRWLKNELALGAPIVNSLDRQAADALEAIDRGAAASYFFSRRSNAPMTSAQVFEDWRDIERAAPAADASKRWGLIIDEQREGVRQLANQARPIVDYLASRNASDRVRRWAAIVAAAADSDQKRPGNAMSALDTVMREGIPAMVPDNGCGAAATGTPAGAGFFDSVRKDLVDEGLRQCLDVRFANIAAEFNRLLAFKFPFSRRVDGMPEATREQVAQFLRVYERQGGHALGPLLAARSCQEDASTFVSQLNKVFGFLSSVAPLPPGSPPSTAPGIALAVAPEFRVIQGLDRGGGQIGDWQIEIGHRTIRERGPSEPATWTSGDPVSVTVRFARDSPSLPVARPVGLAPIGVPTTIGDRTARWDFGGDWALFRLLRAGRAAAVGLPASPDVPPMVLGFRIPVERDPSQPPVTGQDPQSPFTVYMRLLVSPKDKMLPLDVDEFPSEAPLGVACPGL